VTEQEPIHEFSRWNSTMSTVIGLEQITSAAARLAGSVHKTEVLTCTTLDKMTGMQLFFKAEMFQKTGSFKARGALNAIKSCLERGDKVARVVTHSSGNHGQASNTILASPFVDYGISSD